MKRIVLNDEGKFQLDLHDEIFTISLIEVKVDQPTRSGFLITRDNKKAFDLRLTGNKGEIEIY